MVDSLEEHERVLALSRIVDKWAEEDLGGEPDWGPLERALPVEWCGGFIWMSRVDQDGSVIELYKHGITRRYLNLDHEGGSYRYNGKGYDPIDLDSGIEWVLGELEDMGWTRETVYDDAFIAAKYQALRDRRMDGYQHRPDLRLVG